MKAKAIDLVEWAERGSDVQRFWAMVVLLAIKDGASKISYDCAAKAGGDLCYEIGGVNYVMIPPPRYLAPLIADALVTCGTPSPWQRLVRRFRRMVGRGPEAIRCRFGCHRTTISAAIHREASRVVLGISPDPRLGPAARRVLDAAVHKRRRQTGLKC